MDEKVLMVMVLVVLSQVRNHLTYYYAQRVVEGGHGGHDEFWEEAQNHPGDCGDASCHESPYHADGVLHLLLVSCQQLGLWGDGLVVLGLLGLMRKVEGER